MALFWFLAGMLTTLAVIIMIMPLLRANPRFAALPSVPWPAAAARGLDRYRRSPALGVYQGCAARSLRGTVRCRSQPTGFAMRSTRPAARRALRRRNPAPASMSDAIASLESRLAKGGGNDDDWELLAKSFEFLGRPQDASQARAHQLPPLAVRCRRSAAVRRRARGRRHGGVSGEVSLAPALRTKAPAGATLFIVAKSVDSPGHSGGRISRQRRHLAGQVHAGRFPVDDAGTQPLERRPRDHRGADLPERSADAGCRRSAGLDAP